MRGAPGTGRDGSYISIGRQDLLVIQLPQHQHHEDVRNGEGIGGAEGLVVKQVLQIFEK